MLYYINLYKLREKHHRKENAPYPEMKKPYV